MFKCSYCSIELDPMMDIKYWLDEKWFVKGSTNSYPFCGCECGTKFYNENNYIEKEVLKNVR